MTDTTERRKIGERLHESEERFHRMADSAPVLIWMSDTQKRCTWFNKPWLEFVGRPMDEEVGDGWTENVHPDDLSNFMRVFAQHFDARQPFTMDYRLRRHDGEYRWIHATGQPFFEAAGSFSGYIGSCIDITDFKRSEEALRNSERKLRKLLDTTGVIPWEAKADTWVFTYVGPQAVPILGYPLDQWYEPGFWTSHLHPEDRESAIAFCRKSSESCKDFEFEYRIITARGETVWLRDMVNCECVNGVVIELRGFMIDITSQKAAETALNRSRHELRELSASLLTAADDEARRIARELHDSFGQRMAMLSLDIFEVQRLIPSQPELADKRLRQMTKDISAVAEATHDLSHRLHPGVLSQLGLVTALESECASFSKLHGIKVAFSVEDAPEWMADTISLCLYRVVQESLQNIGKHSQAKAAKVLLRGGKNEIVMVIRDSGKGFDYNAVRGKGGIGFVNMEERVRLVNGSLSVSSAPGEGLEWKCTFPLVGRSRRTGRNAEIPPTDNHETTTGLN